MREPVTTTSCSAGVELSPAAGAGRLLGAGRARCRNGGQYGEAYLRLAKIARTPGLLAG